MFNQLADWLDDRTGYRGAAARGARRADPRRRALAVRLRLGADRGLPDPGVTGLLLMTSYSPSSSTAWGSVYYISHEMWLRLVHPGHPPLRLAGDDRPAGPAPAPGALGGGLSPAPRGQLVVRHGPAVPDARLQPDRLPAPLGPEGLLGDQGRDQHHGRARRWSARTSRRSSSAAPSTATRRSRGSTACTSASCRPCSSSAWRRTSPCSAGTA